MSGASATWTVEIVAPGSAVPAVEAAIEPFCFAVSSFEAFDRGAGLWLVTGYAAEEPDRTALAGRVALAGAAEGCTLSVSAIAPLPDTDWLAENRRSFKPVQAGRYRVVPVDLDGEPGPAGPGGVVIRLNAGPAFGSGTHETTRGCLIALDRLARHRFRGRRPPRRVLDLGAGSGILAIAAAKTWPALVVATDIDPVAVRTVRENAAANGVAARIVALAGAGFRPVAQTVAQTVAGSGAGTGRFDLVVANIQARPLVALAGAMRRHVRPGGTVVLSGLLARHAPAVQAVYRAHGFGVEDRIPIGDWTTLVLRAADRTA